MVDRHDGGEVGELVGFEVLKPSEVAKGKAGRLDFDQTHLQPAINHVVDAEYLAI